MFEFGKLELLLDACRHGCPCRKRVFPKQCCAAVLDRIEGVGRGVVEEVLVTGSKNPWL